MSAIDDLMELADNYALERSFANEGECITARNALIEYAKDVEAEHMHELRAYRLTVENLEKQLIDEANRFANEKLRADQVTKQHDMQSKMHSEAANKLSQINE